nr:uncharacterized protein LOC111838735 [Paramormyrops kingsleyae]XP_023657764.1 uncharacterized protein LOC111838735 [Paramormyrops kingsleyae]XP_023657765.1 uncharacterized protein LOC111838735 [Paramormyrops kingsleyae]XP_023657766.1 uncharacterized protein LOC111838735 [Paramormyrops kingsleyae]
MCVGTPLLFVCRRLGGVGLLLIRCRTYGRAMSSPPPLSGQGLPVGVSRCYVAAPTSSFRHCCTRMAVSRITEIPMNDLNPLCNKLGVECFNEKENQFLMEYCTAMKPLTAALDILQGDNCSYGALIPTLEVLMTKTLSTKDTLSRMTAGLPDVIVKAIQTRFADVLENKDALLAAVSCPQFKLRWVRDDRRQRLKELLIAECGTVPPVDGKTVTVPTHWVKPGGGMDFYEFGPDTDESYTAEQEVMDYLRCGGYELHTHNQFPNIKNVFLKYNTPTPSSAPVERLFSLGGIVLTPRRNRLSDRRFEMLLLMRYNHCFSSSNPIDPEN